MKSTWTTLLRFILKVRGSVGTSMVSIDIIIVGGCANIYFQLQEFEIRFSESVIKQNFEETCCAHRRTKKQPALGKIFTRVVIFISSCGEIIQKNHRINTRASVLLPSVPRKLSAAQAFIRWIIKQYYTEYLFMDCPSDKGGTQINVTAGAVFVRFASHPVRLPDPFHLEFIVRCWFFVSLFLFSSVVRTRKTNIGIGYRGKLGGIPRSRKWTCKVDSIERKIIYKYATNIFPFYDTTIWNFKKWQ